MITTFFNSKKLEKGNLKSFVALNALQKYDFNDEVQVEAQIETHIDYLMGEYETNGEDFCFDTPDIMDHFASRWKDHVKNYLIFHYR